MAFNTYTLLGNLKTSVEAITPSTLSSSKWGLVESLVDAVKLRSFSIDLDGIESLDRGDYREAGTMKAQKLAMLVRVWYPRMNDHLYRYALMSTDLADLHNSLQGSEWRAPGSTGFDGYRSVILDAGVGNLIVEHRFYTVIFDI